jgi:DNA-directed RNA polymerase subunit RPC12/RpoP
MADTFDCPKCGAPVKYNSAEQGYLETITCPYCGESIVIPAEMHPQPPAPQPVFQPSRAYQPYASSEEDRKFLEEMDREDQEFNAKMAKRDKRDKMVSTIGTIVGLTIGGGAVILFVIIPLIISLGFGVISLFNQPSSSSAGTSVAHIAPTHAPTPTAQPKANFFRFRANGRSLSRRDLPTTN